MAEVTPPTVSRSGVGWLDEAVAKRLAVLVEDSFTDRIRQKDPLLWVDDPESPEITNRLGWLDIHVHTTGGMPHVVHVADTLRTDFDRIVLCGMGGSSLAPEVIAASVPLREGFPTLVVLDSTHPECVENAIRGVDLERILFVISSKSGTTIETLSFLEYFWGMTGRGEQFIAVTDPGTPLAVLASERGFRGLVVNPEDIGGRYSALSFFGLTPAAFAGANVEALIRSGEAMASACESDGAESPGLVLGAATAEAYLAGRDKLTLIISRQLSGLGHWIEQLVAESTGKDGKGILPVVGEPEADAGCYGADRFFVWIRLGSDSESESRVTGLREQGHPVVEVAVPHLEDLGGQFFLWEYATAVVGAVIGVNPFDQPNVAESKSNTASVLAVGETLASLAPLPSEFLDAMSPGEYVAFLLYSPHSNETEELLANVRRELLQHSGVATTVGYGPRYLHSTGQLHKGGPPSGRFVLVVDDPGHDVEVPGRDFTFGQLMRAQAIGDASALSGKGLKVAMVADLKSLARR